MDVLFNKRGLELAIGTVAVIAVVLLVVIVVVGFLLGGFGRAGGGIAQISGEGEKGAANLSLDFQCLGTVRMTNDDCKSSSAVGSPLCNNPGTPTATVKTGAKCSDINERSFCNDVGKARGCYWGLASR